MDHSHTDQAGPLCRALQRCNDFSGGMVVELTFVSILLVLCWARFLTKSLERNKRRVEEQRRVARAVSPPGPGTVCIGWTVHSVQPKPQTQRHSSESNLFARSPRPDAQTKLPRRLSSPAVLAARSRETFSARATSQPVRLHAKRRHHAPCTMQHATEQLLELGTPIKSAVMAHTRRASTGGPADKIDAARHGNVRVTMREPTSPSGGGRRKTPLSSGSRFYANVVSRHALVQANKTLGQWNNSSMITGDVHVFLMSNHKHT
jgi:hypothetical protein